MKKKWHLVLTILFLTLIGLILTYYHSLPYRLIIVFVYIAVPFGVISDFDMVFMKAWHRHWLFHSIIWLVGVWFLCWGYPELMILVSFIILAVGFHCLCDVSFTTKGGTYCIKLYYLPLKGTIRGLNYFMSTVWLVMNFWCSVVIFGITVWGVA